jgi:hypothetical protein
MVRVAKKVYGKDSYCTIHIADKGEKRYVVLRAGFANDNLTVVCAGSAEEEEGKGNYKHVVNFDL